MNDTDNKNIAKLKKLSDSEWEKICAGCGLCCLVKYEDDDGTVTYSRFACNYLDLETKKCTIYENRFEKNPLCHRVTVDTVIGKKVLPASCAYCRAAFGNPKCVAGVDWKTIEHAGDLDAKTLAEVDAAIIDGSENWPVE